MSDPRQTRHARASCRASPASEGTFHALRCKEYGTKVVGGVTPGKGGTTHEGFPVFNTVAEARAERRAPTAR